MRAPITMLASSVVAALFVGLLDHRLALRAAPPTIEVVDLQQLLTEQVTEVSRQKLSVEEQRAAATTFATALSTSLDEVAQGDHAVLLVKPAVLLGAVDATDAVRSRLHHTLDVNPPSTSAAHPKTP